jgi:cytochrome c oxidase assembly protein subunit 15
VTPLAPDDADSARRLSRGFLSLLALTFGLIVLGALVRAHEAGLACPDWPLCFGEVIPELDVKVAFEWTHRVVAGAVSLIFAGLGWRVLRRPGVRRVAAGHLVVGALLLAVQILLGALTVWKLLASWSVTSHLITGNAFAVTLLWTGIALREAASPSPPRSAVPLGARAGVTVLAVLLVAQMVLGGLVSSRFAGLACPEWPACNGGLWFPSWRGTVGLALLHRWNGTALIAVFGATAFATRSLRPLARLCAIALVLGILQVGLGIANVLLGIPVEITGAHSALAAALVMTVSLAVREAWRPSATTGET